MQETTVNSTVSFELSINQLRALVLSMAKSDLRYYLIGMSVRVQNKKLRVATTDGHRLLVLFLEQEVPSVDLEYIIDKSSIQSLIKSTKNKRCNQREACVTFSVNTDSNTISCNNNQGLSMQVNLIESFYPDILKVVPKDYRAEPKKLFEMNSFVFHYIIDAYKAYDLLVTDKLYPKTNFSLMQVVANNSGITYNTSKCNEFTWDFFYKVMPMRTDNSELELVQALNK